MRREAVVQGRVDRRTAAVLSAVLGLVALLVACGGAPPVEDEAAVVLPRIENEALGIAIAALVSDYAVTTNEGSELVLTSTGEGPSSTIHFEVSDGSPQNLNLVAARDAFSTDVVARGGVYKGQAELITHLGNAFFARGRFPAAGGGEVDEMVIFLLHPWGDRQLRLRYQGPAADGEDGKARFALFTDVLAEVEGLPVPTEPASPSEPS